VSLAIERTFQGIIACRGYRRTWAFPQEVTEILQRETAGLSVLHLFGGQASWGVRLDADRSTNPHVVGNAFHAPFHCGSFDVVICDPPYPRSTNGLFYVVLRPAACLARQRVWWFSTEAIGNSPHGLKPQRWWAVFPSAMGGRIRFLCEYKRTRHPSGCFARGTWPAQIRKYDWRSQIEHPNLALGA